MQSRLQSLAFCSWRSESGAGTLRDGHPKIAHRLLLTQSFPVVCDSPSPGTSRRNRENPAPLRAHASTTIGTENVPTLVKVRRMQLCACLCLLCGRETHASTTQSDPLLLPTRNDPYQKDRAPRWGYLF